MERADAIHNVQRAALLVAAIQERRYDIAWDARVRSCSSKRANRRAADILAMPRMPGLLGIALSGAGPSVIALATGKFSDIGKAIAERFRRNQVNVEIGLLAVGEGGLKLKRKPSPLRA